METDNEHKKVATSVGDLIEKKLLSERKVFLWGEVNDKSAKSVTEKLIYLALQDAQLPISFYINTPGGSITAGMAIYDTMKLIQARQKASISVVVTGLAASMGSILLCGATKGQRFLYPHARVLIHQPLIMGHIEASAVDIHIQAQEMEKSRAELNKILAEASGQSIEKITHDTDRDFYLNATEAIQYGLADAIITDAFK